MEDMHARHIVQKLRDDLHLFQNPSLALATINSYETIKSQTLSGDTITVLSSHSSQFKAEQHTPLRAQTASKQTLRAVSGEKLVRASSASRAAHVLAQRFNLQ